MMLWAVVAIVFFGLLAGAVFSADDFAEVLNSYAWGNNPYWLEWICKAQGRLDCWT